MKQTSKLNKEWHLAHRMPKNPTLEQRIAWHIEHKRNCACREIPEKIMKAITEQNKPARKKPYHPQHSHYHCINH